MTKGTFLDTAARDQTTTMLADGRALIAGGTSSLGDTKTAEIYDPATETFSPTGSMLDTVAWSKSVLGEGTFATSVLLHDGRAMILLDQSDNAAELYNPASGTFSKTAPMIRRIQNATVTLLPDGKVLVAGGCCAKKSLPVASAQIYDPATDIWTSTASLHYARASATATLLSDGRVLVAGGNTNTNINKAGEFLSSAEIYDPTTGRWSDTGSMNGRRAGAATALLQNGEVLVAGGSDANDDLSSAEIYDPEIGSWKKTGSLTDTRPDGGATFSAVLLLDGRVLMNGGVDVTPNVANVYDPASGSFSRVFYSGLLYSPVRLDDGRILMIGLPESGPGTTVAVLYQP